MLLCFCTALNVNVYVNLILCLNVISGLFRKLFLLVSLIAYVQSAAVNGRGQEMHGQEKMRPIVMHGQEMRPTVMQGQGMPVKVMHGQEMPDQHRQHKRSPQYYTESPKYYTEAPKYYTEAPKYYTESPKYYTTVAPSYVSINFICFVVNSVKIQRLSLQGGYGHQMKRSTYGAPESYYPTEASYYSAPPTTPAPSYYQVMVLIVFLCLIIS